MPYEIRKTHRTFYRDRKIAPSTMGWLWKNDGTDNVSSSSGDHGGDHRATRKVVSSQCRTEEVEPGKFIRKCEKTEQIFKDCIGRPSEMVQSTKEYTEEDVTEQMTKGPFPSESYFPGLRRDIEGIEQDLFGGMSRFFEAAEDLKNEFFSSIGVPKRPSSGERGIHVEGSPQQEALPSNDSGVDGDVDLSSLAKDV
ncbi:Mal d 1-associated protein [Striga asiatica]|uniref:Mal d 1-associated protein n=1 Tax=Striga asiatica TaxID=4170 RepID=A0A5A7QIR6_STRAF|nr:Mal d 1-associated protein [Striga asiatica]